MDKLDPQVQIKIIELAEKWARDDIGPTQRGMFIGQFSKCFDKAYKAIIETITEIKQTAT